MHACLPVCLFAFLPVSLPACLSVRLPTWMSVYLPDSQFICLPACPSVLSVRLSYPSACSSDFCLSFHPSVHLSVRMIVRLSYPSGLLSILLSGLLSVRPSVLLSVCPSVLLSVHQSFRLSFRTNVNEVAEQRAPLVAYEQIKKTNKLSHQSIVLVVLTYDLRHSSEHRRELMLQLWQTWSQWPAV